MTRTIRLLNCRGLMRDQGWGVAKALKVQRMNITKIAASLSVARSTVNYNLVRPPPGERVRNPGPARPPNRKRVARMKLLKMLSKLKVKKKSPGPAFFKNKNPRNVYYRERKMFATCKDMAHELARRGFSCCVSTVRNNLLSMGARCRRRPRNARREINDEPKRKAFAIKQLKNVDQMKKHLYTDEKIFNMNDVPSTEWIWPGEYATPRGSDRWGFKVHMWGMIGIGVKRLVLLPEGGIGEKQYMERCLTPNIRLLKSKNRKLMQDGAKGHTSNASMQLLLDNGVALIENWPPRSPDLNPIEQLWGRLVRIIDKMMPITKHELTECIEKAWDSIPRSEIDALCMTFERRCRSCVEVNGASIPKHIEQAVN